MTYAQLITLAQLTATAGTDIASNPVMKQRLNAEALTELALQELATVVAQNRELRQRLEKRFTVTLSNGEATIPAGMLSEYLRESSVRDSDTGANNGAGNIYARVFNYNQFLQDTQTNLGLYCLYDNKIIFRPPGYTDPTATIGPALIDAPFTPTKNDLDTEVPDEITNELVELLAERLQGKINALNESGR